MGVGRTWRTAALGVAGVLALSACMGLPTSGPVQQGDVVLSELDAAIPIPTGPRDDDTPEEIVNGFLAAASSGVYDDYETAREFLMSTAFREWRPRSATTIYDTQDPEVHIADDEKGGVTVALDPIATVDAAGRYTEAAAGAPVELELRLDRDANGEWRIADLPDGVLMSWTNFVSSHRQVEVYFATRDAQLLVPEVRWFQSTRMVEQAVRALVGGPSPWLRDAVRTGVPAGSTLPQTGVTIDDAGGLTLDLESTIVGTPDELEDPEELRNLFQAQLEATLAGATAVEGDISVRFNGWPWEPTERLTPRIDPAPDSGPFVLADGEEEGETVLAEVEDGTVVPLADVASLEGIVASRPAISLDGEIRVLLDAGRRLVLLPAEAAAPEVLLEGTALLPPSVDRDGWIWTAEHVTAGELTAVSPTGDVVVVPAAWLAGREVRSVRVSRDGARIAVAYQSAEGPSVIEVAAVQRDTRGRPQALGRERIVVGAALNDVREVSWYDEVTLAVLGSVPNADGPTAYLVPLGGASSARAPQAGAVDIAASPDRIYLLGADGVLRWNQASTWTAVVEGVRDPAFPG